MKKIFLLLLLAVSVCASAASLADEALFNQIINAQKDKLGITDRQSNVQDRNLQNTGQTGNTPQNNLQNVQTGNTTPNVIKQPKEVLIYGHDMFGTSDTASGSSNQFVADQNVNVPDDYVLGSGDTVRLQFWGRTAKTEELVLDRSGEAFSETLGKIVLGGQTYGQAKTIVEKMVQGMEGVSASLVISNTKTVKVLVSGGVNKPGYYIMNVFGNVTQAIVNAGGVKDFADIRRVAIIRNGRTVETIDYYELINKGSYRPKIQKLMPNDVIFVPRTTKRVLVEGAIKNEAYYDIRNENTVNDVIRLAGGLASNAVSNNVVVTRVNKTDLKYTVKSLDISKGRDASFRVEDGDKITIYGLNDKNLNSVKLTGNVVYPGNYEFRKGMRISDIIKSVSYLLPDTEMSASYIVRKDVKTSETVIVPFSLDRIMESKHSAYDIALQAYDEIVVVGKYTAMENIHIDVSGEVVSPGDYAAKNNATVYEMIVKAGGLTANSDKSAIEIISYLNGSYSSEYMDINKSMSAKAPLQGFIVVHGIYESAMLNYIEISGDIMNPGEFFFHKGMSLRELLDKAVSPDKKNIRYSILIYRKNTDTSGSEVFSLDLKNLSDPKVAYTLKQGDKVIVKQVTKEVKRYVNIEGAVFDPGTYQYADNLTAGQLITMAGGLKDSAYYDAIELIRKEIADGGVEQEFISVNKDEIAKFSLMAGDRLVVRDISEYNKMDYVTLSGEVKFPGRYPIKKGEKLSSIIERAGGFTDFAYLKGAAFSRVRVRVEKQKMLDKMIRNLEREILVNANVEAMTASTTTSIDSSELMLKTKDEFIKSMRNLKADGRVVLKLSHPRLLKGSSNDLDLENGDELYIPKAPSTVVVSGSVLSPGAFVYNSKMDWEDYIKLTGGLLSQADKKNIFIMKSDGTAQKANSETLAWSPQNDRWEFSFFSKTNPLDPGDIIMVPDNYNRVPWMRNIKDITQIMMQIAVTAGVLTNL
ncbi:SLBB domain-containing protein [Seleniivibrio woodruffii]|uniref:Protein involved in polysaccharide export with SLBB domain n=1 Tax=Seleniivibrio woodruffii TaxID=1078050 RepID=A0A4R1KCV4_9BACT|nr:SLBB domain-containing protein [Seleniivibrio woodruffii]TCK62344.1 protein involved in polysaccharide export with SLBB domain [Seleniivibrio woodruffii]TVZ34539.1 protein involved in polysaccharide export with SLBB domain [Seleniivibrio woodruffii]